MRQDRVAHQLLLPELADHVCVVARGEALLARHERGDRLHLVADLHEGDARTLGELGRGNVDAHLLQPIGVELRGQAEVFARPRQQLRLQERVVRGDLGLERGVGLLVARDLVLPEQLGDALHVERAVAHVLLDLRLHRPLQAGDGESLADAVARELEHRREARLAPARYVPRALVESRTVRRETAPDEDWNVVTVARAVAELQRAGVNASLGAHGQREGLAAHWEMWMMVKGGLTPHQALRAATLNGARYLGLDADIGSLEPGKLAVRGACDH